MPKSFAVAALLAACSLTLGGGSASAAECREDKPGLLKQAKVTCDDAKKSALAKVPGGKVKSSELEVEKGRLVWSFDLVSEGKAGVEEVQNDAKTGAIVSVEHETKEQDAAEAKADEAKADEASKR